MHNADELRIMSLINYARSVIFRMGSEFLEIRESMQILILNNRQDLILGVYQNLEDESYQDSLVMDDSSCEDELLDKARHHENSLFAISIEVQSNLNDMPEQEDINIDDNLLLRINEALIRLDIVLANEERYLDLIIREELYIYQLAFMEMEGGVDNSPSMNSILFIENRLEGLLSWLDALDNGRIPDIEDVWNGLIAPENATLERSDTRAQAADPLVVGNLTAQDNNPPLQTYQAYQLDIDMQDTPEENPSGFFGCISALFTNIFNRLFVPRSDQTYVTVGEREIDYTGSPQELESPSMAGDLFIKGGCG
jgi:hypothetical protein